MAVAIDTLAYARRLREAGFSEQQAEGQAEALAAAMTDTLATKQDLRELAAATKQDLQELAAATKRDLQELAGRLEVRFAQIDARFAQIDSRFEYLERHLDTRLSELEKRQELRLEARLSELQHGMTLRLGGMMVAGFGVVSILVRVL